MCPGKFSIGILLLNNGFRFLICLKFLVTTLSLIENLHDNVELQEKLLGKCLLITKKYIHWFFWKPLSHAFDTESKRMYFLTFKGICTLRSITVREYYVCKLVQRLQNCLQSVCRLSLSGMVFASNLINFMENPLMFFFIEKSSCVSQN